MTIDKFMGEMTAACAGLPGDKEVVFKCIAPKEAGQEFGTINSIRQVGGVKVVYPDPGSEQPAQVLIEFA